MTESTRLTITEAARLAGVARSTLFRAVQRGRLSRLPDGTFDVAELQRAGYTLRTLPEHTERERSQTHRDAPSESERVEALQAQLDDARQQIDDARSREARNLDTIDSLTRTVERQLLLEAGRDPVRPARRGFRDRLKEWWRGVHDPPPDDEA